jgi:Uma2 family endonuclease
MWRHLDDIAEASGGHAFIAPLDVGLAEHSVVQPDVIYVSAARLKILQRRIVGPPDLLVEVLFPGTARRDRGEKLSLYAQTGIREYWIVEPAVSQIEFLVNEAGRFVVGLPVEGVYQSGGMPEIHLDLAHFWRKIQERLARVGQ